MMYDDVTARRRAEEILERSNADLSMLAEHLERIREDERTRIARELHDELGQLLSGAKWELERMHGMSGDCSPALADGISSVAKTLDCTMTKVRSICHELRPSILDNLGLKPALERLADDFAARNPGLLCHLHFANDVPDTGSRLSTAIYRIVQESLSNVRSHSGASEVWVRVEQKGDSLQLVVSDNGCGFSELDRAKPGGLGLIGIRERVKQLGGTSTITGDCDDGTTVMASLPF